MKCFYHQSTEAVGSCKSCFKGLCSECAVDRGKGLACRGRCEADVDGTIPLIDRNIRLSPVSTQMIQASKQGMLWSGVFFLVIGLGFIVVGLTSEHSVGFTMFLGVAFIVFGGFQYTRYRRVMEARS